MSLKISSELPVDESKPSSDSEPVAVDLLRPQAYDGSLRVVSS